MTILKNYKLYCFCAALSTMLISIFVFQLFMTLLCIFWLFEKWDEKKKPNLFEIMFILLLFLRILSIFFAQYPSASYITFTREALLYVGFFAMNYYLRVFSTEQKKQLLMVMIVSGVVVSLVGITQFMLNRVARAESFTSGYMTFANYLLTIFSFTISMNISELKKNEKIAWTAGIALLLTGIVTSLGRTSVAIALVVAVGVAVMHFRSKIVYIVTAIVLAALLSGLAFKCNHQEIQGRIQNVAKYSDRDILYKGAVKVIGQHPYLGFGPTSFHEVFPYRDELVDKGVNSWHNDYLQMYIESGIFAFILYLLLLGSLFYKGFVHYRNIKDKGRYESGFALGLVLALVSLCLTAVTAGFIFSPVLSLLFAFLVANIGAEISEK